MSARSKEITFPSFEGAPLAARLDYPEGKPRAFALFAHCFACSTGVFAAARIASALTSRGFAVLRFDFTGLGMAGGDFTNTDFSANVQDLAAAARYLRETLMPVDLLIGHSLGGTAALAAACDIGDAKAVVTIGAPADAASVTRSFAPRLDDIGANSEAIAMLAGRPFAIKRQFLEETETARIKDRIAAMRKALFIFHAPLDQVVGVENAGTIFRAARHPKSFLALHGADHLLTKREDAVYVADVLGAWASRYIPGRPASREEPFVQPQRNGAPWAEPEEAALSKHH